MFKNFLMKKMLKSKMGADVPDEKIDEILNIVQKNPELFQKIGNEVQAKMKEGKDQMTATMEVMREHQDELKKLQ